MDELEERFCRCIVAVYRRQMHLLSTLAERQWSFELNSAILRVGGSEKWATQILSIETPGGDWMWAWADDGYLQAETKKAAQQLFAVGKEKKVPEFTTSTLSTKDYSSGGHTLAVTAAAQFAGIPYFVAMNGSNRLYLLIADQLFRKELPPPTARELFSLLPQLISDYSVPNHRLALLAGLRRFEIPFQQTKRGVVWADSGSKHLAEFDESNRITGLEG